MVSLKSIRAQNRQLILNHKIKLTGFWVNWLERKHRMNTWCETSVRLHQLAHHSHLLPASGLISPPHEPPFLASRPNRCFSHLGLTSTDPTKRNGCQGGSEIWDWSVWCDCISWSSKSSAITPTCFRVQGSGLLRPILYEKRIKLKLFW